jgi:hypothetical protein
MNWLRHTLKPFAVALIFLTTSTCHPEVGEKPVIFAHPETVCLGRIRMTVPGPGPNVGFIETVMDGVKLSWIKLPEHKTFEEAWQNGRRKILEQDDILREYPFSTTQVGVVSRFRDPYTPLKGGPMNTIEVWKNFTPNALTITFAGADPNSMPLVEASVSKVLNSFQPYTSATTTDPTSFCIAGGAIHRDSEYGEHLEGGVGIPAKDGLPNLILFIITTVVNNTVNDGLWRELIGFCLN